MDDAQTEAINDQLRRNNLSNVMKTLFAWDMQTMFTLHEVMLEIVRKGAEFGFNKFQSSNGQNCIVMLGIGDDLVGLLTDVSLKITKEV